MAEISIQPPSDVYDTFGRLNYKPWYALAEFVDNATQNYFDHKRALKAAEGRARLHIDIGYDSNSVTVSDDANGMNLEECLVEVGRLGRAGGRLRAQDVADDLGM
jgi:hypothetical protein